MEKKEITAAKSAKFTFPVPDSKELLKAGVQFGHQIRRWNPKMQKYIYTQRGDIHIIDIAKTRKGLEEALNFLVDAASRGEVLFVGTKRQAREVVVKAATEAGTHYVIHRWVGGLLTNFGYIQRSLKKLAKHEEDFETGVEGRTKFEVSRMKKEWERLNRLYSGVKQMEKKPTAIVILDVKYEKNALREALGLGIPTIAVVDTNSDPDAVSYPIPGNDDAVAAIELYFDLFVKAVKQGNKGKGVKHDPKDYSKVEVEIKKVEKVVEQEAKEVASVETPLRKIVAPVKAKSKKGEGILEGVQKAKESGKKSKKPKKPAEIKLTARAEKALKDAKLSIKDAKKMKDADLLAIKGIGQKALEEIKQ